MSKRSQLKGFSSGGSNRIQDRITSETKLNFLSCGFFWELKLLLSQTETNRVYLFICKGGRGTSVWISHSQYPDCLYFMLIFQLHSAMCCQEIGLGRTFIVAILRMLKVKIRITFFSEKFWRVKETPHGPTIWLLLAQTVQDF